ncbi:deoxyribodipyrimidine photolyase [Halogeometricum borinquense DSM 11551]|uniref:Deoxyribodipyrimidine photo-lyase type I n=1 Tax=Halogeometricum borinquense (strain ATCC 700274 / DSM 11551 / JCM 10706 / KCTC 4070 / PR3) TaxID=469382 RepID=E4NT25_HALBP|nr:deoxyribodipyrimidine photo-lyase [Halogeometricum borinquense]ADQ67018.1 deoxyribodipyrimidine photo-lyase type I [Halogeometricum borinquense DSM 11551]ELY29809.1 deoxyribodipyrimidine photolyase [Halogeometricum borinquense DSM 11551]
MHLHWHRRDLRVSDNHGLVTAADAGDVVPVFVFDDDVLAHAGAARVRFMLDALARLRETYRERDSDLVVVRGDPTEELPRLAAEYDADGVVWNKDYSRLARTRDEAVRRALDEAGVAHDAVHDAIHHEPGSITTNAGDPYSVYTYFWKKWRNRNKADPFSPPEADSLADVSGADLPTIEELGFSDPDATIQEAGTEAARERLAAFCEDAIYRYATDRDYPERNATSRLSADLKWGTIGIREVYAATEEAAENADSDDEAKSVEEFQSQLAWREFYTHVLYFNPDVVTQNYKEYENDIAWREDEEALTAWKEGRTGYPIVDAGMRQLREEAYMHNRMRMIVASFLTKDLLIDWREGYAHFRAYLADHDTANDNGGWQWAASTGTDAQPYFRIFNPMTQGERYDPDATYIQQYVPELRDATADEIHDWPNLSPTERETVAPEYPDPIVEHSKRRDQAISMFEAARGDDGDN